MPATRRVAIVPDQGVELLGRPLWTQFWDISPYYHRRLSTFALVRDHHGRRRPSKSRRFRPNNDGWPPLVGGARADHKPPTDR